MRLMKKSFEKAVKVLFMRQSRRGRDRKKLC